MAVFLWVLLFNAHAGNGKHEDNSAWYHICVFLGKRYIKKFAIQKRNFYECQTVSVPYRHILNKVNAAQVTGLDCRP